MVARREMARIAFKELFVKVQRKREAGGPGQLGTVQRERCAGWNEGTKRLAVLVAGARGEVVVEIRDPLEGPRPPIST